MSAPNESLFQYNSKNEEALEQREEEIFDEAMDEGKAGYNFAFYMILFITFFTGGYYAYGKIKDKFFPQSTVSDYVKKKWRYWDDRRSQVYTRLVKNKCFYVFLPNTWRIYEALGGNLM